MPNNTSNLPGRLARIERHMVGNLPGSQRQRAQWRAELAERFADAKYDAHRAELIDALCSDTPHYEMHTPAELHGLPATEHHFISWYDRDAGAPIIHIFIMPDPEEDPNREA